MRGQGDFYRRAQRAQRGILLQEAAEEAEGDDKGGSSSVSSAASREKNFPLAIRFATFAAFCKRNSVPHDRFPAPASRVRGSARGLCAAAEGSASRGGAAGAGREVLVGHVDEPVPERGRGRGARVARVVSDGLGYFRGGRACAAAWQRGLFVVAFRPGSRSGISRSRPGSTR